MSDIGNSNRISRAYLDSLLIETRYMDSETPSIDFELFGTRAASPIMTAALSHLDHDGTFKNALLLAEGARDAGCDFALADWKGRGWQDIPAQYKFTDAQEMLALLLAEMPV